MGNNNLGSQLVTAIASSNNTISFTLKDWSAAAAISVMCLTAVGIYSLQVFRDLRLSERRLAYECCE